MPGAFTSAIAMLVNGPSAQGDAAGLTGADRLDQEIHPMPVVERHRRIRKGRAVESRRPMNVLGRDQLPGHRPGAAGIDSDIGPPGEMHDLARIERSPVEGVAGDGDDAEHVDLVRRRQGKKDGDRIVLPGIRIDDDLLLHGSVLSVAPGT